MPCGTFAGNAIFCVRNTRCPRDGPPVFWSSCTFPPQMSVGLFSVRVGCSAWKIRMDPNSLEWNERPRVVSFHSNRSNPENPDDRRSLAITNERDRFIGGNGEDKKSERYFEKHICCPHLPLRTTATTYKIRVIFTAVVRTATAVVYSRYPDRAAARKGRPR